jgi:2',3'-cyclic-nucleotide 2'-phosphodiesterase (5'-nucleotidase family)
VQFQRATLLFLLAAAPRAAHAQAARDIVILYTNDFHTALNPIPAYWRPGSPRLGGAAWLAGLANRVRAREHTVFLFDAGDMFTGMTSYVTRGEMLMEMMRAMRYDAFGIGNHEFDYGADNFERQMARVPYPVLGANIYYKGTLHRYSRPYVILERDGVRIAVIGIIGEDARSVALPSGVANLDFEDPATAIAPLVRELRPQVDLVVVLAHEGKTGPMQTDAEGRPEVQRDFDEDIRLAGAVPGIDVLVGGHAHRGIEVPYVHPRTGTIIVQTYGYGTRLGFLRLRLAGGQVAGHEGRLLEVWTDSIAPDSAVAAVVAAYRARMPDSLTTVVGTTRLRLTRDYRHESVLGDFVADVLRTTTGAEIGFENAGGLRADIPEGAVTRADIIDALPFVNRLARYRLTGAQVREVIEQGLTLERGMIQVSGLRVDYDLTRPVGQRAVRILVGGRPLEAARTYTVGTQDFVGQGGDLYATFAGLTPDTLGVDIQGVVAQHVRTRRVIERPEGGRLVEVGPTR